MCVYVYIVVHILRALEGTLYHAKALEVTWVTRSTLCQTLYLVSFVFETQEIHAYIYRYSIV